VQIKYLFVLHVLFEIRNALNQKEKQKRKKRKKEEGKKKRLER